MEGAGFTIRDGWIVWEVPGKPVSVRLSPGVVRRLGTAVRQTAKAPPGMEIGGILIGSRTKKDDGVVIRVDDFEPVEREDATEPSYVLSDRDRLVLASRIVARQMDAKSSSIVGFYRSHSRPELAITREDATLFSAYFKHASDVFFLVKPDDDGSLTGGFIIREGGEVVSKSPYVQFPLQRTVALQTLRKTAPREPFRIGRSPDLRRAAERAAFWLPAAGVLTLAVALYWGIPTRAPGSITAKPLASPSLNVAFSGDSLRLSWDQRISKRADHAVLWIKDGPQTQRLELNSKQVRDGSVVYRPKHGDVEFRFEALSAAGSTTESVRAIGGPSQAAVVLPAPAAVAVEAPRVSPAPPKTPPPNRTADSRPEPNRPHPNAIGMASRQASATFEFARAEHTPAPIVLPDAPAIDPKVVRTPSNMAFLGPIPSVTRPDATGLPVRVSVEPVQASRRSFPAVLRHSPRSDFIPPVALRDPGLANPPRRSVARNVSIDVKVYVNSSGKVDYSEVLSEVGDSNRDLAALAVFSARRWEFVPARTKDGTVPGEVIIHYQFGPATRESGNLAER